MGQTKSFCSIALVALSISMLTGCNLSGALGKSESKSDQSAGSGRSSTQPATLTPADEAARVLELKNVSTIASGNDFTCAVRADSSVACWGVLDSELVSTKPSGLKADVLTAGAWHACAIERGTHESRCWGSNEQGQLASIAAAAVGPVSSISAGAWHTCALREKDAGLVCWGQSPELVDHAPSLREVKAIAMGHAHGCALEKDGNVSCWPKHSLGVSNEPSPTMGRAKMIAAGNQMSCAILEDYTVECWGKTDFGHGSKPLPKNLKAKALAIGSWHACAVAFDDSVVCWGSPDLGVLNVPEGLKVSEISAGGTHTCALAKANGAVVCWGVYGAGREDDDSIVAAPEVVK